MDDQTVLERIRSICFAFPGAEEAELQDRPLFRVGRSRFAIFNGIDSPPRKRWDASGRSLHFLADPEERDALLQDPRLSPSPHHGTRGWVAIQITDRDTDWQEIAELLDAAYRQVAHRR